MKEHVKTYYKNNKEYIICSAIWYKDLSDYIHDNFKGIVYQPQNIETGFVVCGRRHHNIISTVALLSGMPTNLNTVQGFLTNTDRFVDRVEGLKIAKEANQLLQDEPIRGNQLYSENLW
jgi:hypothetical protein